MTLTDTGPLVAFIDKGEPRHAQCAQVIDTLPSGGMTTTWPCLTEAAYLLYRQTGWPGIAALWQYVEMGKLRVHIPSETELRRVRALMTIYRDTPCDLADASLVAAAETLDKDTVFTLDGHFHAYWLADGKALIVVP